MNAPFAFTWDGDAMVPTAHFKRACDKEFVVGQVYRMETVEERSVVSHRHYFATLHEYWLNLPEHLAERFPSAEHLRKYALIKAGFYDERSIVAGSKAEAQRLASFIKPMDDFAIVTVSEAVVRVFTAKSQSMKAMGRKTFQESKDKVLDLVADMIGVSRINLMMAG